MDTPRTKKGKRRLAGFTLIEIMAVVLIIGLLVTVVGRNVIRNVIAGKKATAQLQISQLAEACEEYRMNTGKYPESLDQLLEEDPATGEAWFDRIPLDPWGNEYAYDVVNGRAVITSYGRDGEPGGEGEDADISSRKEEE